MPAPTLLEAINRNALAVFLLVRVCPPFSLLATMTYGLERQANVATGVVNMSMQTMYASDGLAMSVLSAYAFGVCVFAWAFRRRRVWKL